MNTANGFGQTVDVKEILSSEYDGHREDFDIVYYLVGFFIILIMMWYAGLIGGTKPQEVEEDLTEVEYTLADIQKYNGKSSETGNKIFIGCCGRVFDVTQSPNFNEGGMYEKFAGHDISIACAHYSTDEVHLGKEYDRETAGLTFSQEQNLQGFFM